MLCFQLQSRLGLDLHTGSGDGLSQRIDGLTNVDALILGSHVAKVHGYIAKVMLGRDTGAVLQGLLITEPFHLREKL